MIKENIKQFRKLKKLTQEDVAMELNVVRQTVSKWESGLSVPDAELLIKLAKLFEVPVATLLGESVACEEQEDSIATISEKLTVINEQLARNTKRTRKIIRGISIGGLIGIFGCLMLTLFERVYPYFLSKFGADSATGIIGGADGATGILLISPDFHLGSIAMVVVLLIAFICGIYFTRKK